MMKGLFYILGLLTVVAACTNLDCSEYGRVVCTYDVQDNDGDEEVLPLLFSVNVKNSIDGGDTTLINLQSKTTSFSLPMSYVLVTDTLFFSLNDTAKATKHSIKDTVYVTKTSTPHYEGYDCAPRYFHELIKAWSTHNFIDTLKINNRFVKNNAAATNIHLIVKE